jgi:hypothetical protein
MMFAFIDSSVLCADFFMKGINFNLIKKAGIYVILSEIVIAETKNKYRELLQAAVKKSNGGVRELSKLGVSAPEMASKTIDDAMSQYADFLEMFIIESGMTIPEPYPTVSHNIIVDRALARKKPFKSDGKDGYRDFLVWQTFLDFVKITENDADFYFVTQNTKDFSDDTDDFKLHPDLMCDIQGPELTNKKIHYYPSIGSFVEGAITPKIRQIEDNNRLSELLLGNTESFVEPIVKYVSEELDGLDVEQYEIYVDGETPEISSIDGLEIEEIQSISKVCGDEFRVQLRLHAFSCIYSYIYKSELAAMTKKEFKRINITNPDWNKHYAAVENEVGLDIDVEVLLILNEADNNANVKIETIEVSDVSDSSYCPYCPNYEKEEEDDEESMQ